MLRLPNLAAPKKVGMIRDSNRISFISKKQENKLKEATTEIMNTLNIHLKHPRNKDDHKMNMQDKVVELLRSEAKKGL